MTKRRRRMVATGQPTEVEWAWLTAAPNQNGFLMIGRGRLTTPERLRSLWDEYQDQIRRLWAESPPDRIPHGHPIFSEMPADLRSEPDPRGMLAQAPPADTRLAEYRAAREAWLEARRDWFRGLV